MLSKIVISHKLNIPLEEVDRIIEYMVKNNYMYFDNNFGYKMTKDGKEKFKNIRKDK